MVDSNKKTYRTEDLPFAAFLHASRRLRFLCCERGNSDGRVAFVFDDPNGRASPYKFSLKAARSVPLLPFTTVCGICGA